MGANYALFGSAARGGSDDRSDVDVICVLNDFESLDKGFELARARGMFGDNVGLSIYSRSRIEELWGAGSPFAWHLFLESVPLKSSDPLFLRWTAPEAYADDLADSDLMAGILSSVVERLRNASNSSRCYEAGLLYVCARNIGMFASRRICGTFDFSRYAPQTVDREVKFPLPSDVYDVLIACRHASTRGKAIPRIDFDLQRAAIELSEWAKDVRRALVELGGE